MEIKTIGEALAAYAKSGPEIVNSDYRAVVDILAKHPPVEPIPNHCFLDALYLTSLMFGRTNKSLCMLTGKGVDSFLQALSKPFEAAIERIQRSGGKARFVVANELPEKEELPYLTALAAKSGGAMEIAQGLSRVRIKHFIVCDGRSLRLEEKHEPLTKDSPIDVIQARVFLDNPVEASGISLYFEGVWRAVAQTKTA